MKYVTAIIRPYVFDQVRDALTAIGIQGMSAWEVTGFGRQRGHSEIYRGAEYAIKSVPKVKIELFVNDNMVQRVVDTIQQSAQTGKTGDGKICVIDIEQTIRIRTGEVDDLSF